ncbi:MAG: serine hydrolase [Gemmatimonadetes bacterium]|nr:serine hydrolase [Gemmatimonadota bacterium]
MRRDALVSLLLVVTIPCPARAQSVRDDPRVQQALHLLDLWLDGQRDYQHIPGISAGVVYDQELIWSQGYGYQDRESRVVPSARTIYSICSISKLFTSIAVMQLRDQGKLRLDDSVRQHLPWFSIQQAYPDGPPITIEGLLTHASGLPREADWPYWTGPDFTFPTREQVIQQLARQQTLYPAETYYQYSNLGLTLAGEIVQQVSGQPYADYVRQHILEPLGLSSTSPEIPGEERGQRLATGYGALSRQGTRSTLPVFQARGMAPAAGFASSVEDLARFAQWQFRLLSRGGTEILAANSLKEMQRVHWTDTDWRTTWGLGFTVWRNKDKTFVGHGGSCPGYRTQLSLQADDQIATIFMANALGVSPQPFTMRMYQIVAPAVSGAKKTPGGGKQPDPSLAKYYGSYEQSFGGETAVIPWEDGLAIVGFPTDDPMQSLSKLKHVSGDTFRRVRDDSQLAEEIVFETNARGDVTRLKRNSNYSLKVR